MTSNNQSSENITGTLYECVTQCVPETALTSAELTTERQYNTDLRARGLWTANFALYQMEEDKAVLYFGGRKANPIFNNIQEAVNQLKNNRNYRPAEKDIAAVLESVKAGDTLRVELSELNLSHYSEEVPCFKINPKKSARLNSVQRALAEEIYGSGNDFVKNMKMFAKAKINPTVYVLNPQYVKTHAKKSPIARACWLLNFYDYCSCFDADVRDVGYYDDIVLRGVRRRR